MSNSAQPARYDLPWKAVLTHAFHPFMDFYFPEFSTHIDCTQRPRFRDKELPGFGIGTAPDLRVADMLVEIVMRDGRPQRLLLHIEIQTQRDAALARRVNDYNYRIGKTCRQPVTSMVLLADTDPHWRPGSFRERMRGNARTFTFITTKLLDCVRDVGALEASDNPVAWFTLAHWRTQQTHHAPRKRYAAKLHLTKLLFQHGWNDRRIMVLFNAINWMMVLPEPYQRRYWQAVLRLEKERDMKLLNPLEQMFFDDGIKKGREQGLEQGLGQGLEKGRTEGAAALLERLLAQRFGPLPPTARRKLSKASVAQLEAWSDALAEAQSLKQVFGAAP